MSLIYILCAPAVYEAAGRAGEYAPDSLALEGFIHASPANQLTRVANKYYQANESLCVLTIDENKVSVPVKWETISNGDVYPHLYGPLNMDAVVHVHSVQRAADGTYAIQVDEL